VEQAATKDVRITETGHISGNSIYVVPVSGQPFEQVEDKSVVLATDKDNLVVSVDEPLNEAPSLKASIDADRAGGQDSPSDRNEANPKSDFPDLGERYEVLEQIGAGGMGTVWKVHDRTLDKTLAIKILRREMLKDTMAVKRFEQESKLAADLTHVNIASVYGSGTDKAGDLFIIMNYVDGESLSDILKREGKLSQERAMDIFHQICAALTHSHMKGVIHRDIKPSNIIISKTASGADLVHVVDFGIAKSIYGDIQSTQALTRTEDAIGSPLYISPEQCLGEEVTEQSDMYSLGCVLYEMLTGAPPFKEKNPVKLLLQHLHEQPDYSEIPEKLLALTNICLQKDKRSRPKTVGDLLDYATDRKEYRYRDFNGSPQVLTWAGLVPSGVFLLVLPTVVTFPQTDIVDKCCGFGLLWILCFLFWIILAAANGSTAVRSTTVRVLEQSLFVVCFLAPVVTVVDFVTDNNFSVLTTLGAIAMMVWVVKLIQKKDIYDRMFFWRHHKSWTCQAEALLKLMFRLLSRLNGVAVAVGGALYCVVACQLWRISQDMGVGHLSEPAALLISLTLFSVLFFALSDLLEKSAWPSNAVLSKILVKALHAFIALYSSSLIGFALLSTWFFDPSYTSFLRQLFAFNSSKPAALTVQHEVLAAPNTAVGDLARVMAVSKILSTKSQDALSSKILDQVTATDTVPLLRAIGYQQLSILTARKSGWQEAIPYFEKALEQLREPEPTIGWQNPQWKLALWSWHPSRIECALDLAWLAYGKKDFYKAREAISFIENSKLEMTRLERGTLKDLKERVDKPPSSSTQ